MPKKAYGQRYAQAVFELALEKNELERWQSDLEKISGAVADKEFLAALESPKIALKKKSELLSQRLPDLNPLARNLLHLLIANPGQTLDRETLLNKVWGYDWYGNARVVDTHVQHLRRKLHACYPDEELILTVRGVGYRFAA